MTIETRMKPRTEREKDLLKYGRRQERERIIKLLDEHTYYGQNDWLEFSDKVTTMADLEALIKGEQK